MRRLKRVPKHHYRVRLGKGKYEHFSCYENARLAGKYAKLPVSKVQGSYW